MTAPLDFERAEDLASRQWEMFERADAVLVASAEDAALLQESGRGLYVEVAGRAKSGTENEVTGKTASQVTGPATSKVTDTIASKAAGEGESSGLSGMLQRIFALAPGTRANDTCSVMQVETLFRERLAARSGEDRILGQLECYVRLAENLLSEGKAGEGSRAIAAHLWTVAAADESWILFFTGLDCAQALLPATGGYRNGGVLRRRGPATRDGTKPRRVVPVDDLKPADRLFSVIVPTYNRLPILKKVPGSAGSSDSSGQRFRSDRHR